MIQPNPLPLVFYYHSHFLILPFSHSLCLCPVATITFLIARCAISASPCLASSTFLFHPFLSMRHTTGMAQGIGSAQLSSPMSWLPVNNLHTFPHRSLDLWRSSLLPSSVFTLFFSCLMCGKFGLWPLVDYDKTAYSYVSASFGCGVG